MVTTHSEKENKMGGYQKNKQPLATFFSHSRFTNYVKLDLAKNIDPSDVHIKLFPMRGVAKVGTYIFLRVF